MLFEMQWNNGGRMTFDSPKKLAEMTRLFDERLLDYTVTTWDIDGNRINYYRVVFV